MKKHLIPFISVAVILLALVSFAAWLFVPPAMRRTENPKDYLRFDKAVQTALEDQAYCLPDASDIADSKDVRYLYLYKPEHMSMDQFCIHLSIGHPDEQQLDGYLSRIGQIASCRRVGDTDVWLSPETVDSAAEKLNADVYDGMPLYFYVVTVSAAADRIDFWICKLEDSVGLEFHEFEPVLEMLRLA